MSRPRRQKSDLLALRRVAWIPLNEVVVVEAVAERMFPQVRGENPVSRAPLAGMAKKQELR